MHYQKSLIQDNILKCDQCNKQLTEHDEPKNLPCYNIICSTCEFTIRRNANNDKQFKCRICLNDHFIPESGFVLNKRVNLLIQAEPMEISLGKEYDDLKLNLRKLEILTESFKFDNETLIGKIKEHCIEQIRLIQLSTENKIEQINKLNDELIQKVTDFEAKCIESLLKKNEPVIREQMTKLIDESYLLLNEADVYLEQLKINDEEMKQFNKKSEEMQLKLNKKSIKLNSLVFDNKLIKFVSNNNEINKYELGHIDYEQLEEKTKVFIASKNEIQLWDLESKKCIKKYEGHTSKVICVKNAPGNRLISGCYDGSIKIWDRKNGECIKTINDHTKVVREIFINSNDKLVTNSLDQTIRCFDLNSFDCLWKIDADARSCDLLSNNKLIFCDDHIKIQVWETNTCTCLKTIEYNAWRVKGISDELIATGSFQNEIIIWNIESGTCLKTLQRNSSDGYIAIIQSLESFIKISDEQIASGLDKNTIKIWNINSGQCLKIINTLSICSLKKLSDKKIISCSSDRIQVWDIETGECLKLIETDCYNFDF